MKVLFGAMSLLVALAIVGMLVAKQIGAAKRSVGVSTGAGAGASAGASGSLAESSRAVQDQARSDVAKALEQAAAARKEDADK